MQVTMYCIRTNGPTYSVDRDLGRSSLTELFLRDNVILWCMNGMYGMLSRDHIKEAKRICDDSPGSDYIFTWSNAEPIPTDVGRLLSGS